MHTNEIIITKLLNEGGNDVLAHVLGRNEEKGLVGALVADAEGEDDGDRPTISAVVTDLAGDTFRHVGGGFHNVLTVLEDHEISPKELTDLLDMHDTILNVQEHIDHVETHHPVIPQLVREWKAAKEQEDEPAGITFTFSNKADWKRAMEALS